MATRPASSDVGVTGRAAILAGLWLAVVGVAGATGVNRWSRLVWLAVTAVVPLGAFVLAWWRSARFRATVLDWDLLVLTWLESRRVPVGIGLLVFYQEGRLHGRSRAGPRARRAPPRAHHAARRSGRPKRTPSGAWSRSSLGAPPTR